MKKLLLISFSLLLIISCDPEWKRTGGGMSFSTSNMYTMEPVRDTFCLGDTINFSINIPKNFIKNNIDTLVGYGGSIKVYEKDDKNITNYFTYENIYGSVNPSDKYIYIYMIRNNDFYSVKFRMILKNSPNYLNENITGILQFGIFSSINLNTYDINTDRNNVTNASFTSTFKHNNEHYVEFYVKDTIK